MKLAPGPCCSHEIVGDVAPGLCDREVESWDAHGGVGVSGAPPAVDLGDLALHEGIEAGVTRLNLV